MLSLRLKDFSHIFERNFWEIVFPIEIMAEKKKTRKISKHLSIESCWTWKNLESNLFNKYLTKFWKGFVCCCNWWKAKWNEKLPIDIESICKLTLKRTNKGRFIVNLKLWIEVKWKTKNRELLSIEIFFLHSTEELICAWYLN